MSHSLPDSRKESLPIEEYGIIGDLRTAALAGSNGSIDMLCFPRFDSPAIFCAHVDPEKGGRFLIQPLLHDARRTQLYVPDTNVLLSRFLSQDGIAEISSFMTCCHDGNCEQALVRRVKAVHGTIRFRMVFKPTFDYARAGHKVRRRKHCLIFESEGQDGLAVRFRSSIHCRIRDGAAVADFELKAGESASFIMEEAKEGDDLSPTAAEHYSADAFKRTSNFWRSWISHCRYQGRWRESVHRSALALKLLVSREFGSIIAAPSFGFPNDPGGERNWDYRYTWIRDASFTTYALMRLGFTDEAAGFMHWLEERIGELDNGGKLQIMYGIDGRKVDGEFHLDHLAGFHNSRPIRIGSTNHDQIQLDIYGELMDSIYLFDKYGSPISHDLWADLVRMLDFVAKNWMKPDSGIWEVRGGNREFLYSRVMCWVAIDRAMRLAQKRSLPAPMDQWLKTRDEIYHSVFKDLWDGQRRAFVQFKGTTALDASCLIMPLVRFISPTDPRWLSTLKAVEEDLVEDSLVYRYRVGEAFSDELRGEDGTFSICSFWLVECISRAGDLQKARHLFEKMFGYSNALGLFSEQLGTDGRFLGNLPQAFTHLAHISAAYDLDRRLNACGHVDVSGGRG